MLFQSIFITSIIVSAIKSAIVNPSLELGSENSIDETSQDFFSKFQSYNEHYNWYQGLAQRNPKFAKFIPSIGMTYEKNNLFSFTISETTDEQKPIIYMHSLMHAREWISGSTLAYLVKYLSENTEKDPLVKCALSKADFVFVPIVNPDGYKYSHEHDRHWRRTRSIDSVVGVDLNRNFPAHWLDFESFPFKFKNVYPGPHVGSEKETKAVMNLIGDRKVLGSLDFHSYSQLILYPYGYTNQNAPSFSRLHETAKSMSEAITDYEFEFYSLSNIPDSSEVSGTFTDWIYNQSKNQSLSFSIELPPTRPEDFALILPNYNPLPSEIKKVGENMIPALRVFLKEATGCYL